MALLFAGKTDIGLKRSTNQDSIFLDPANRIFIVADGMGGHNGGDIASSLSVKEMPAYMLDNPDLSPEELLLNAVQKANETIYNISQEKPDLSGMGTTVVAFYFKDDKAYILNVGDSRAYLVNKNQLFQLSKDHSLISEKINMGIYTRDQGAKDPHKNVLTRSVGFEEVVEAEVFSYKVNKYDLFFICSDGLHGKVSEEDILHIVNETIPNPRAANQLDLEKLVSNLIDQANANGGPDNTSVISVLAK